MKNKIITAYLILLSFATIFSLYIPKNEVTAKEEIVIPNEAIRLRILANSDAEDDQQLKRKVRDAVNAEITKWVQDLTSLEDARATLQNHLPEIQQIAEEVVKNEGEHQTVKAQFDKVKFPTKLYGQFLYPAGEYEAILITLGAGEGANWWCVLFPPLCFLDFSNGVAVSDGFDEKENKKPINEEAKAKAAVEPKLAEEEEEAAAPPIQPEPVKEETETQFTEETQTEPSAVAEVAVALTETPAQTNIAGAEKTEPKPESKAEDAQTEKPSKKQAPVFTAEDEEEVEVKFFIKELWTKIF